MNPKRNIRIETEGLCHAKPSEWHPKSHLKHPFETKQKIANTVQRDTGKHNNKTKRKNKTMQTQSKDMSQNIVTISILTNILTELNKEPVLRLSYYPALNQQQITLGNPQSSQLQSSLAQARLRRSGSTYDMKYHTFHTVIAVIIGSSVFISATALFLWSLGLFSPSEAVLWAVFCIFLCFLGYFLFLGILHIKSFVVQSREKRRKRKGDALVAEWCWLVFTYGDEHIHDKKNGLCHNFYIWCAKNQKLQYGKHMMLVIWEEFGTMLPFNKRSRVDYIMEEDHYRNPERLAYMAKWAVKHEPRLRK